MFNNSGFSRNSPHGSSSSRSSGHSERGGFFGNMGHNENENHNSLSYMFGSNGSNHSSWNGNSHISVFGGNMNNHSISRFHHSSPSSSLSSSGRHHNMNRSTHSGSSHHHSPASSSLSSPGRHHNLDRNTPNSALNTPNSEHSNHFDYSQWTGQSSSPEPSPFNYHNPAALIHGNLVVDYENDTRMFNNNLHVSPLYLLDSDLVAHPAHSADSIMYHHQKPNSHFHHHSADGDHHVHRNNGSDSGHPHIVSSQHNMDPDHFTMNAPLMSMHFDAEEMSSKDFLL